MHCQDDHRDQNQRCLEQKRPLGREAIKKGEAWRPWTITVPGFNQCLYIYIFQSLRSHKQHGMFLLTQTASAPSLERKLAVAVDRTSSSWQERLEHLSEELLMRS